MQKRMVAFCMAAITVLFVIACIPAPVSLASAAPCSENPLPLSLAGPVRKTMYFLPSYDEASGFTPARKLYDLPVSCEIYGIQAVSVSCAVCEALGQATDLFCIESIAPRAP